MANAYQDTRDEGSASLDDLTMRPAGLDPPPPIDMRQLRLEIQRIRAQKRLSINDLMMRSGLSRTAVIDMLNGRGRVSCGRIDSWWALAWALGVPFGELLSILDTSCEEQGSLTQEE